MTLYRKDQDHDQDQDQDQDQVLPPSLMRVALRGVRAWPYLRMSLGGLQAA